MARTPKAPAAQPATGITIDRAKLTIGDIRLFSELGALGGAAVPAELLGRLLAMLDRLVIGGVEDRAYDELPAIIAAVTLQLNEAGNQGN